MYGVMDISKLDLRNTRLEQTVSVLPDTSQPQQLQSKKASLLVAYGPQLSRGMIYKVPFRTYMQFPHRYIALFGVGWGRCVGTPSDMARAHSGP